VARRLSNRRPVLLALTGACALAHAAVLGGLPRLQAAFKRDASQHSVMHVTSFSAAMPEAPQRDAVVTQRSALDAATSAAPTPKGSAARTGTGRAIPVAPREPAPAAQPPAADAVIEHLPTSALDVPPMPRSAPDEQYVEHVHRSGLPMQIRVFIDASGSVTETRLLGAAPGDEEAIEQVMAMFRETSFSPGRLHGREVASFIDIELVLEPAAPSIGRIVRQ
jgi:hypothetical protein